MVEHDVIDSFQRILERAEATNKLTFGPEDPVLAVVGRQHKVKDEFGEWKFKPIAYAMRKDDPTILGCWGPMWHIDEDDFFVFALAFPPEDKVGMEPLKGWMTTENFNNQYYFRAYRLRDPEFGWEIDSTPANDPPMQVEVMLEGEFDLSPKPGRTVIKTPRRSSWTYPIEFDYNSEVFGPGVYLPLLKQQKKGF